MGTEGRAKSLELASRPTFVSPFILACRTKTPKLSVVAVTALQRIIVSKGLAPVGLGGVEEDGADGCRGGLRSCWMGWLRLRHWVRCYGLERGAGVNER